MIDVHDLHKASWGARRWSATMPAHVAARAAGLAGEFLAASRQAAPYRTGQLRRSLRVRLDHAGGHVRLRLFGSQIGRYTITGTRPHIIRARNAQALRFYWAKAGQTVFFRQVHHPGTKPNDWRPRALALTRPALRRHGLELLRSARTNLKGAIA